jgi:hypothetical protein
MPGHAVQLAAAAAPQGVVDHQDHRGVGRDQHRSDEVQQGQSELVSRPAGGRKEPVGQVVVAPAGQPGADQHPGDGALARLVRNPATSAWKVRKVGWVKQGPNAASRSASERGRLGVGIGGDSLADEPPMLACLALPGKPVNSAGHHHRNHETRAGNQLAQKLVATRSLVEAEDAVVSICGRSELSYERQKAAKLRSMVAPTVKEMRRRLEDYWTSSTERGITLATFRRITEVMKLTRYDAALIRSLVGSRAHRYLALCQTSS